MLSRMLIAFERVGDVGRSDVGRRLFVASQKPRAGTVANRGGVFEPARGTPVHNVPKGFKSRQKGVRPKT